MYLSKLILVNYRSCKFISADLLKDEPNILIGINDCGKTTFLKGAELLLSEKPQVNVIREGAIKKDASNSLLSLEELQSVWDHPSVPLPHYSGNEILVVGKFVVEEDDLSDPEIAQMKPHSLWVLENSIDNGLWFCRTFDKEGRVKNLLLTKDSLEDNELASLFLLNATQLNKLKNDAGLTSDEIVNENTRGRFSNIELIRALYQRKETNEFWVDWKWEKSLLPSFKYLDWNSSFDNILDSATEALKELISEYLNPVRESARVGASAAQEALNQKLGEQRSLIASVVPQVQSLTANLHFEVKEKITDLLITKIGSDSAVHMDLQGDGIKRQIWFALVKATVGASSRKKFFWAFDEPETHLYPTAQRQLFEIIKEVSSSSVQSIISTHSTVFIDRANLKAISIISQVDGYSKQASCSTIDEVYFSLQLRNSDFLFYDGFLLVEGDTEEYLIPEMYKVFTGNRLEDDNIKLIPLGGASKWMERKRALESVFSAFNKTTDRSFYLFDNDQRQKLGSNAIDTNRFFFIGKQDVEDAIDSHVWVNVVDNLTGGIINPTVDAIQALKDSIPRGGNIPESQKFLSLLKAYVRDNLNALGGDHFAYPIPSKGKALSEAIMRFVTRPEQIPEQIAECIVRIRQSLEQVSSSSDSTVAVHSAQGV